MHIWTHEGRIFSATTYVAEYLIMLDLSLAFPVTCMRSDVAHLPHEEVPKQPLLQPHMWKFSQFNVKRTATQRKSAPAGVSAAFIGGF